MNDLSPPPIKHSWDRPAGASFEQWMKSRVARVVTQDGDLALAVVFSHGFSAFVALIHPIRRRLGFGLRHLGREPAGVEPRQHLPGLDPITASWDGQPEYDADNGIPWDSLVVINPPQW